MVNQRLVELIESILSVKVEFPTYCDGGPECWVRPRESADKETPKNLQDLEEVPSSEPWDFDGLSK